MDKDMQEGNGLSILVEIVGFSRNTQVTSRLCFQIASKRFLNIPVGRYLISTKMGMQTEIWENSKVGYFLS